MMISGRWWRSILAITARRRAWRQAGQRSLVEGEGAVGGEVLLSRSGPEQPVPRLPLRQGAGDAAGGGGTQVSAPARPCRSSAAFTGLGRFWRRQGQCS